MPNPVSLMYWNDTVQRGEVYSLTLLYKITAAKTVTSINGPTSLPTFDAYASQAVIDDFLGTTNEFLLAAFDATAMGADMFGAVVNMGGQASALVAAEAVCFSGTDGATSVSEGVNSSTALTASTLLTECAKGANGNLAFKVNFGNTPDFDGLTAGLIKVTLHWRSK